MRLRSLLPMLLALLGGPGLSALDPATPMDQYPRDNWQTERGLPENQVSGLLQTRDGYLWLATQEGVARFDGARFAVFDRSNTPAFAVNRIRCLAEDSEGVLWIGTNGGGLVRASGGTFSAVSLGSGPPANVVTALLAQGSGGLWVGTNGGGLYRLRDGVAQTFTTREGLPSDMVTALCDDGAGGIWVGTNGGGVARWDGRGFRAYGTAQGLGSLTVSALCRARGGSLWVGTLGGGLARLDGDRFTTFRERDGLGRDQVLCILEDRDGSLWVGTHGGGLSRLALGRWDTWGSARGAASDVVRSLFEDREGNLWVGHEAGGLTRLHDGAFRTFGVPEGLSSGYVMGIYEDRAGAVWVWTNGGGINRLEGGRVTTLRTADGLGSDLVRSAWEAPDGSLWVGTDGGGLAHLRGGRVTERLTRAQGLSSDRVMAVLGTRDGDLWAGTYGGGLNRLRGGHVVETLGKRDGLGADLVNVLFEDAAGGLWVSTYGGLSRLERGKPVAFRGQEALAGVLVCSLWEDPVGTLWIGTLGAGLLRLKDGEVAALTKRDGLADDVVFDLKDDGRGRFWMTCNRGVYRADRADVEAFLDGRRSAISCTVYGQPDGMRSSECNGAFQPSAWRMRDGRLWFPTIRGAALVDPARLKPNTLPPPVYVQEFLADGRVLPLDAEVRVPPGRKQFEFHYAALSYTVPERVRYRYRLEGFRDNWEEAGTRRTAYFTNLAPGHYLFRVQGCNSDGVWNEAGASFAFVVEPRFYQTLWFYLLAALALGGLLALYLRFRTASLRGRALELQEQVAARTRDLAAEKEKSESLLLNILPADLVRELKAGRTTPPRRYEAASILFTDFKAFTAVTSTMPAEHLVAELNDIFGAFDDIVARRGMEKIRTTGDSFMAVAGVPRETPDHALRCVEAALEMQAWLEARNADAPIKWQMRAGVHSGNLVAGVVGRRKFAYDVWGDTVNIASRMEQHGEPGRVNISGYTYYLLRDRADCTYRGKVEIKGKGEVDMYFVDRIRDAPEG